jgi:hypothetical protein
VKKIIVALVAVALMGSANAKVPSMKLSCAKIAIYKTEAERQYVDGIYNINVTFITKRPDNKLVDKVLRECLAVSIKLDGTKDILATAWFRPIDGMNEYDDEQIDAYGSLNYISYKASSKSIDIHTTPKMK